MLSRRGIRGLEANYLQRELSTFCFIFQRVPLCFHMTDRHPDYSEEIFPTLVSFIVLSGRETGHKVILFFSFIDIYLMCRVLVKFGIQDKKRALYAKF